MAIVINNWWNSYDQKVDATSTIFNNICFATACDNCVLVAQSCLTLYDPMACSPPGSSVHGDSPGKNTRVGCHSLLQGIFPTQGWTSGLPHAGRFFTI